MGPTGKERKLIHYTARTHVRFSIYAREMHRKTDPLCVRLILSAIRGAISIVSIMPLDSSIRAVWSMVLVS